MRKYIECRRIYKSDLRKLCVKNEWYTLGYNDDYDYLFSLCENNITISELTAIATDIKEHSETLYTVTDIMYELAKISVSTFTEINVKIV